MDAAMNRADASNSFSPCALLKRPVERTHISRGILRIRTNVMEFGRFTGTSSAVSGHTSYKVNLIILHAVSGKQWSRTKDLLAMTREKADPLGARLKSAV
jgi:hypothetical protein